MIAQQSTDRYKALETYVLETIFENDLDPDDANGSAVKLVELFADDLVQYLNNVAKELGVEFVIAPIGQETPAGN